jgi:decaprenylphospho-beta-D-ribofuranose 2-oxidase
MVAITHDTKPVRSFGRCAAGVSQVYEPTNVDEIMAVFDIARKLRRRVAIRGGGHSFDGQAVHNGDTGDQIILRTECLKTKTIEFDEHANKVTLGSGVKWGDFVDEALAHAKAGGGPIRIPGSMQTGSDATAGGTLSGDCLSRSSGTAGKESHWIDSFRIVTPQYGLLDVTEANDPDLFHAVIGGHGYIGFVTDITYKLIAIPGMSCAHSDITLYHSFRELIEEQGKLLDRARQERALPAISSVWFTRVPPIPLLGLLFPTKIKGAVFQSWYDQPSAAKFPGFPLYSGDSELRYWTEVMARIPLLNWIIHEVLYGIVLADKGKFENDLKDFIFFMDGDTMARKRFEASHPGELFPIAQQTFVVPTHRAEAFAERCMSKVGGLFKYKLCPSECDMLPVKSDKCLLSANYDLEGYAISLGFEPIAPDGCPPGKIVALLRDLSKYCLRVGGRIHLVKNVYADKEILRSMFSPQIQRFEEIKRKYDPDLLLRNPFSDKFFDF